MVCMTNDGGYNTLLLSDHSGSTKHHCEHQHLAKGFLPGVPILKKKRLRTDSQKSKDKIHVIWAYQTHHQELL